jgi:hypothetical protein
MRRWLIGSALFTGAALIISVGLNRLFDDRISWWHYRVNKASVLVENRTDESVEIIRVSVGGKSRVVNSQIMPGEFTMLLGFYAEITPGHDQAVELLLRPPATGLTGTFHHRPAEPYKPSECDFKLVIGPGGIEAARSCPEKGYRSE